jgi:hypothetical protein
VYHGSAIPYASTRLPSGLRDILEILLSSVTQHSEEFKKIGKEEESQMKMIERDLLAPWVWAQEKMQGSSEIVYHPENKNIYLTTEEIEGAFESVISASHGVRKVGEQPLDKAIHEALSQVPSGFREKLEANLVVTGDQLLPISEKLVHSLLTNYGISIYKFGNIPSDITWMMAQEKFTDVGSDFCLTKEGFRRNVKNFWFQ